MLHPRIFILYTFLKCLLSKTNIRIFETEKLYFFLFLSCIEVLGICDEHIVSCSITPQWTILTLKQKVKERERDGIWVQSFVGKRGKIKRKTFFLVSRKNRRFLQSKILLSFSFIFCFSSFLDNRALNSYDLGYWARSISKLASSHDFAIRITLTRRNNAPKQEKTKQYTFR